MPFTIPELQQQIENLQFKVSYQDEIIEQLNQSLISQQSEIRLLTKMLENLTRQLEDLKEPHIARMEDETSPPHY